MGWRIFLMQNPLISSQSWPFPSQLFLHFSQDFDLIVLIGSLATGYALLDIKNNKQRGIELGMTLVTFPPPLSLG